MLTVRARAKADLDRLRDEVCPELSPTIEGQGTDYPFRAMVDEEHLAEAMVRSVLNLDYDNFKSRVAREQGHGRAHTYARVWSVLHDLEKEPLR